MFYLAGSPDNGEKTPDKTFLFFVLDFPSGFFFFSRYSVSNDRGRVSVV